MITEDRYTAEQHILANYKDLLGVDDLAQIFDVNKNTIYNSINNGEFGKPIQIGRAYKVPKIFIIKKFLCEYE